MEQQRRDENRLRELNKMYIDQGNRWNDGQEQAEANALAEKLLNEYYLNEEWSKGPPPNDKPLFYREIYEKIKERAQHIKKLLREVGMTEIPRATGPPSGGWVAGMPRAAPFLSPSPSGVPIMTPQLGYNPGTGNLYGGSRRKKRRTKRKRKSKKRKSRRGRRTRRTR